MPYTHLLVPSDGSALSGKAVEQAVKLAAALGARITFLHAQPSVPLPVIGMGEMLDPQTMDLLTTASRSEAERILTEAAAVAAAAGVPAATEQVASDLPHRAIVEAARRLDCDLIVMASHGRRGLSALVIGSETQRVLLQAEVPVLVMR